LRPFLAGWDGGVLGGGAGGRLGTGCCDGETGGKTEVGGDSGAVTMGGIG